MEYAVGATRYSPGKDNEILCLHYLKYYAFMWGDNPPPPPPPYISDAYSHAIKVCVLCKTVSHEISERLN